MTNDPISDMLTRIRNASLRGIKEIVMPWSKMIESIAKILEEEGFVDSYKVEEINKHKNLKLTLKYLNGESMINHLERVSKPGLRIYMGYKEIPKVKSGMGIAIISTPKGVMSGKKALQEKVGGEFLAKIW